MEKNHIYSGTYKNWHFSLGFTGKVSLVSAWGTERIELTKETVESVFPLGVGETKTKGGLTRAVVGGALFGGVGAIVGASTAKHQSNSFGVCVQLKDGTNASCEVDKHVYMALMNI